MKSASLKDCSLYVTSTGRTSFTTTPTQFPYVKSSTTTCPTCPTCPKIRNIIVIKTLKITKFGNKKQKLEMFK